VYVTVCVCERERGVVEKSKSVSVRERCSWWACSSLFVIERGGKEVKSTREIVEREGGRVDVGLLQFLRDCGK
jgi:hypothetical protein